MLAEGQSSDQISQSLYELVLRGGKGPRGPGNFPTGPHKDNETSPPCLMAHRSASSASEPMQKLLASCVKACPPTRRITLQPLN